MISVVSCVAQGVEVAGVPTNFRYSQVLQDCKLQLVMYAPLKSFALFLQQSYHQAYSLHIPANLQQIEGRLA